MHDRVDADRGDLRGQRLDEPGEPGTQQVRGGQTGDRLARRGRQDHEDRRALALPQVRQRRTDQPERAPQRPVDRLVPGLFVEVLEPAERRAAAVDQQEVQAAQPFDSGRDRRGRTVRGGEVRGDGRGRIAEVAPPGRRAGRASATRAQPARPRRRARVRSPHRARSRRRRGARALPRDRDPSAPPCRNRG